MKKYAILFISAALLLVSCNNTTSKKKESKHYKGMFSYVATTNEVNFTECGQQFVIAKGITKNKEFKKLFKEYSKVKTENVLDYAYVEFEGYISEEKTNTEMDDLKTVVVTKFLKLDKNKICK